MLPPAFLCAIVLSPVTVAAEGIRILGDWEYVSSRTDITQKDDGTEIDLNHARISQLYDVDIQKQIYPNLDFRTGGLFELQDSRTTRNGAKTTFEEQTGRYFGELKLNTPLYRAGAAYRNTRVKTDLTDLPKQRIFREQYDGVWGWRPAGLPSINLNYSRARTYDEPKTRDSLSGSLTLRSEYQYEKLAFDYMYTRNDTEEALADSALLSQVHHGGVRYSTRLFDGQLSVAGASSMSYRSVARSGTGDIKLQTTSPQSWFYLLTDLTPDDNLPGEFEVVGASNPLTSVDIGSDGPDNLVSFGLAFASPTEVDTVHVLPLEDVRDLTLASPSEISAGASNFSWQIFSSDDQETWTEHTPRSAVYSAFESRFEIEFDSVEAGYIKVVVEPLADVPQSRKILISEVRAFTTIPRSAGLEITELDQTYSLGLGWTASEKTTASYDTFVKVRSSEPLSTSRTRVSNSFSVRHIISPVFVGNARYLTSADTDSERPTTIQHSYVASIRGDYLDTFRQTLSYSGSSSSEIGGSSTTNTLFLRNKADLYRDWSVNVDGGFSWNSPAGGGTSTSTLLRIGTHLVPNRRMNLRLDYTIARNSQTGRPVSRDQTGSLQAFWLPVRTLSLFAAVSLRDRDTGAGSEAPTVSQDYAINWAPFPDGAVHFALRYGRAMSTEGRESETLTPEIRWEVARGIVASVTYSTGTVETATETSDVNTFTGKLRIAY